MFYGGRVTSWAVDCAGQVPLAEVLFYTIGLFADGDPVQGSFTITFKVYDVRVVAEEASGAVGHAWIVHGLESAIAFFSDVGSLVETQVQ